MEEDPGSRMTGKTTQAAANEAVTPPTVPEHKRQGLASHQRGEQPKESTVKRKRDGEPTDPPREKPREGGAKRGDELTSTGSSPLQDNSGEYQDEEGDLGTDPVPPLTVISHASAEPDELMPMDHPSQDMALSGFDDADNDLHMFSPTPDNIDVDCERDQEASKDDDRPSGMLEVLDSKEHNLLSAVLSLAVANRGLNWDLETVDYYKRGRVWHEERIHDIENGEQDTVESELPEWKSKLQKWDEDLDHYQLRVEVLKDRVVAACRDLEIVEAMNPSDAPDDAKETSLAMQCLAETGFWADLEAYRSAKSGAKVIAEELDDLRQEQSAIAKRTALFGKHFLDYKLAHDINEGDPYPQDVNPWYVPDLLMETDLLEKERSLERACVGFEQAQAVAISGEQALIGAGLLEEREVSDGDEFDPNGITGEALISHDGNATPSDDEILEQLRTYLLQAGHALNTAAEMFDSEECRTLTQDELDDLPQPVSEEDKGAALFKKLQEHTRALIAAEEWYEAALQGTRDAGIPIQEPADDATSVSASLNRSHEEWYSENMLARVKEDAQLKLDKWMAHDEEREMAPLASAEHAALVSAVPANEKILRSISVGHSEPNEGSYISDRITEMRRRTNQLRSLEQGELVIRPCNGAMVKRPFENAENDQHMSNLAPDKIEVGDNHISDVSKINNS
jgi:hypothetical protein